MIGGAKPKDDARKVTRNPVVHDWTEVSAVPYTGERPSLPTVVEKGWGWTDATRRWWAVVSTMPHCVLWEEADWQFALDTARIHALFVKKGQGAGELRIREQKMGTTLDARRDLRIRYVPVQVEAAAENPGQVSDFAAERRRRLLEADDAP